MAVDPLLQLRGVLFTDDAQLMLVGIGAGQFGTDGKQVVLDPFEFGVDVVFDTAGADDTEYRVEFIDRSVGFDTLVIFGDPRSAKESGGATVSRPRVDLHWVCPLKSLVP